jgi:hypothetical protein
MKSTRLVFVCVVAFLVGACGSSGGGSDSNVDASSDAVYKVSFTADWNGTDFPTNFPGGAHFSGLIGATHSDTVSFWDSGVAASAGVQQVAETGGKSIFKTEIAAVQASGEADFLLDGNGIGSSPGNVSYEFSINQTFSLVTLISMVAPSPDWFVGAHDLDLYDAVKDEWIEEITVDLEVYDAGTDSGERFKSDNASEGTAKNIALLTSDATDTDFVSGIQSATMESVGTFTFERIQ